jgi:hypothetical protein
MKNPPTHRGLTSVKTTPLRAPRKSAAEAEDSTTSEVVKIEEKINIYEPPLPPIEMKAVAVSSQQYAELMAEMAEREKIFAALDAHKLRMLDHAHATITQLVPELITKEAKIQYATKYPVHYGDGNINYQASANRFTGISRREIAPPKKTSRRAARYVEADDETAANIQNLLDVPGKPN